MAILLDEKGPHTGHAEEQIVFLLEHSHLCGIPAQVWGLLPDKIKKIFGSTF